jgi:16S rRNA (adenine1518-N6/adenine1519-N6)-dimethyltransferase
MNLTSPKAIKEIAQQFDFTFKKGLGQNFLTDAGVLEQIASAAQIQKNVLEIGPGFGVLTQVLSEHSERVVAVEIDERLIEVLQYTLREYPNVELVHQDILKMDLPTFFKETFAGEPVSIAANLPYYITTPILTKVIESRLPIQNMVVMVQKEVAERLVASPGTKTYGAISVLCAYYTKASLVTVVPAASFVPPPKVDSAVVKLEICPEPNVRVEDEKKFFRVVKAAFAQRRKTLLNCLANHFPIEKSEISRRLEMIGISPNIRGEMLGIEKFAEITNIV